ncbi:MAG: hypothetical protein ABFC96_00100 [Thermoguttaceae bacterium]
MTALGLHRLLPFLAGIELELAIFWLGLALFTAGLAVLLYTRWGQYKPLRKCMALSLLAHLLLATYAATIQIVTPSPPERVVRLSLDDGPGDHQPPSHVAGPQPTAGAAVRPNASAKDDQPWESLPGDEATQPVKADLERKTSEQSPEPKRLVRAEPLRLPGNLPMGDVAISDAKPLRAKATPRPAARSADPLATVVESPAAQHREPGLVMPPSAAEAPARLADDLSARPIRPPAEDLPLALLQPPEALPRIGDSDDAGPDWRSAPPSHADLRSSPQVVKPSDRIGGNADRSATEGADRALASRADVTPRLSSSGAEAARQAARSVPLPEPYRLRVATDRAGVAESHGGSAETEAAVKAALKWLADNQAADGRWDPRTHDAGKEGNVLGRTRQGAGSRADSAITGLAILAFLASGHTHLDGPYHEDIRRGIEYLMRVQAADGNLAGDAAAFEFMYSHAIASCAMSEAYGMTRDPRLQDPVRRAIGYSVAAQDRVGGGWRYRPGDPGDTSQLGWQLMSLKSAELAGIPIPDATRQGIVRYLRSVSSGRYGGLASYRPGEEATHSMAAEALVCWQFLGLPREHPACNEAGDYLLGEPPSSSRSNVYYWYYATMGMYQLQGVHWQRWNEALRTALVSRQVKSGPLAGSWNNNDDLWGGYGGRVYTTALSALSLEVYYRFLPLYGGAPVPVTAAR